MLRDIWHKKPVPIIRIYIGTKLSSGIAISPTHTQKWISSKQNNIRTSKVAKIPANIKLYSFSLRGIRKELCVPVSNVVAAKSFWSVGA